MFGMRVSGSTGLSAVILAALVYGLPASGLASDTSVSGDVMIAQNGATVPTPKIDRLTCDEMNQALIAISASEYRGVLVVSEDHPDYQIFAYENRLATQHYQDCQVGVVDFTAPSSVFSAGFN